MPQIQVFQCPSCGANLSYDGGPEISFPCQFCGTTVVVPQELRPAAAEAQAAVEHLEAGQPVVMTSTTMETPGMAADSAATQMAEALRLALSGQKLDAIKLLRESQGLGLQEAQAAVEQMAGGQGVDLSGAPAQADAVEAKQAAVQQLARSGQTIEAIKLYRALYGVGLKEAKDAVDAMAGGGWPAGAAPASVAPASTARRAGRAAGCGWAGCGLLFTVAIIGFVLAMVYLPMRMSGSYQQALDAARADPAVVAAMGAPIDASWWPSTGEISCGSTCSANYVIPIHGSRKSGRIIVQSDSKGASFPFNDGTWTLDATVIVDGGPTLNLRTPTLSSPLAVEATQAMPSATQAMSEATQAAQAASDEDATATAVELDQGTATAQAQQDESATAVADAQTSVQTMEAAQGSWPLVTKVNANDPFHGWPTGLRQDSFIAVTSTVKATKYLWTVFSKQGGSYVNLTPTGSPTVTDFYAKVDLQFLQGDAGNTYAYGLVFRRQGDDYGFFGLENDGSFRALEVHNTGITQQLEEPNPAILTKPSDVNHLLVRSLDSNFVFLVNGVVVGEMNADFSDGEMGLGVDVVKKGKPAQVQFSNFEVHAPPP